MKKSTVLISAAAVALLLAGCGGPQSGTATTSAPASAPTSGKAPTAAQTTWAGNVCTTTTTLKKDVEGLATAATSGGSDISAALTSQLTTVKTSATALSTAVAAVPAGSENEPEVAAVKATGEAFTASITDLETKVAALEGTSGLSRASAVAGIGSAAGESLSKLGTTTREIKTAAQDGKSTLGLAFAAAPSCSALNQ
jgi:hypothetical protein